MSFIRIISCNCSSNYAYAWQNQKCKRERAYETGKRQRREGNIASEIAYGVAGILQRVVCCMLERVYRPILGSPLLVPPRFRDRRRGTLAGIRKKIVIRFSWLSKSSGRHRRRRVAKCAALCNEFRKTMSLEMKVGDIEWCRWLR